MANAPVPSLSDRGWLRSPEEKADALLSYFFESDAKQTYLYQGTINNVQYLLEEYGNNIDRLVLEVQTGLEEYFQAYFDSATVEVTANTDPAINPTNNVALTIVVSVTQDGKQYALTSLVQRVDSRFERVRQYVNTGELTT